MGNYYDPDKVEQLGIPRGKAYKIPATENCLVMVLDNGLYRIAADVTDQDDFNDHRRAYSLGHWMAYNVYELTKQQLEQCPNQGRKPSPVNSISSFRG